jgi:trans-aconitate methyltransferase
MRATLVAQFRRPHGVLGALAGYVMAHRASNVQRSRWTVALLAIEPTARLLELGCGPGIAIEAVARRATKGVVIGVDHSRVVLRQARRRNAAAVRAGRVQLLEASYLALPDLGEPFDAIFAVNSLQFAETPEGLLTDLRARLCPGGTLAITFQARRTGATSADSRRGGDAIAAKLRATGYEDVRLEELPLTPVSAVCVLGRAA